MTVSNIVINGKISGNSDYIIPNMSGNSGKYLRAGASGLEWAGAGGGSGIRSMQVWTSNGTWNRPSNCKSIIVTVTGAGGGGSGHCESAGAGGTSERVIDVTNVSSVSVTVGNPGGGTNYAGCGGNGNSSSFGSYCSASGGYGANCRQQHAGGIGGNGSGGNLNVYGGGGNGHGSPLVTVTTHLVDHIMVVTTIITRTKLTTHIDTNLMLHGVLVVMDLCTVTEVLEDVKVLSWSRNSSDKY